MSHSVWRGKEGGGKGEKGPNHAVPRVLSRKRLSGQRKTEEEKEEEGGVLGAGLVFVSLLY